MNDTVRVTRTYALEILNKTTRNQIPERSVLNKFPIKFFAFGKGQSLKVQSVNVEI